jgi:GntR family transcriptional regulator, transcriptional repressor for pyruvate dehydrogenase complex
VADESSGEVVTEALFRPVRTGNAFEDTVQRLLQAVRLGVVPTGDALPSERELALRFAVSRDTVREAIRALADAGYLVSRRGRYGGTFVAESLPDVAPASAREGGATVRELDDVLGLREVLEAGAARAAAARALSAAERETLYTRLRETRGAPAADYRRLDSRLHLTVAELAGMPTLVSLLADNRTAVNDLLDRIPLLPPNIEHSNEQHEALVRAILIGDLTGAETAAREHVAGTVSLLRGFLV